MNWAVLAAFIPTFALISLTPGMCMALSMSLGMTIGVRRTMWMMAGELVGVALVTICAVLGVAALMLKAPSVFIAFQLLGGAYLLWLGWQMWQSKGSLAIPEQPEDRDYSRWGLISQGFLTAVANPKGWAFLVVFMPSFLDSERPLVPQLAVLMTFQLLLEWGSLMLYAGGGSGLRRWLSQRHSVQRLNRVAGTLMMGVGVWLASGAF
ncbi:threonine transporter RhtB [Bacterioplanes sanyensis]|uniref:LysE family translocator n=1 Tax=Bacterioplanes sanyensis TaxID=1249553 RepID=UPI001673DC3F|nr:LysE family translocator [Bacterioplanes sanyensis]GGY47507.1 threonine transporter RhtB [Bacterioplanes sanyensis]